MLDLESKYRTRALEIRQEIAQLEAVAEMEALNHSPRYLVPLRITDLEKEAHRLESLASEIRIASRLTK